MENDESQAQDDAPAASSSRRRKRRGNSNSTTARRGGNFSEDETSYLLDLIESIEPLCQMEWDELFREYTEEYPGCTADGLRRKFAKLYRSKVPTGNPNCPPEVVRAKRIRKNLVVKSEIGDCEDNDEDDFFPPSNGDNDDDEGENLGVGLGEALSDETVQIDEIMEGNGGAGRDNEETGTSGVEVVGGARGENIAANMNSTNSARAGRNLNVPGSEDGIAGSRISNSNGNGNGVARAGGRRDSNPVEASRSSAVSLPNVPRARSRERQRAMSNKRQKKQRKGRDLFGDIDDEDDYEMSMQDMIKMHMMNMMARDRDRGGEERKKAREERRREREERRRSQFMESMLVMMMQQNMQHIRTPTTPAQAAVPQAALPTLPPFDLPQPNFQSSSENSECDEIKDEE